jgi:hypothetical protein
MGYGLYADGNQDGSTPIGFGAWPKATLGNYYLLYFVFFIIYNIELF